MSFFGAFEDRRDEDDFDDFELAGEAEDWESWWCEACGIEWSLNYPACPSCGAAVPSHSVQSPIPTTAVSSQSVVLDRSNELLMAARDILWTLSGQPKISPVSLVEDQGFFLDPLPNSYEHADDTTRVCPTCCAILPRAQTFCHGCHQVS